MADNTGSWWADDDEDDEELDLYDESSIRSRPNPKGNRPRTKTRPEHADAEIARVLGVDRGRYTVLLHEDTADERQLTAARSSELRRNPIVNGDRVAVVGDTTGEDGTLARIVRIEPRTTLLRRSADDTDEVERVIVANADQMLIVVAAANPEPRTRLVDRYLVAAYDAGIEPMLCVTKTDLADPEPFLANFAGLDLPVFTSRQDSMPVHDITEALIGHDTVVVGHSGVGKSTLVNHWLGSEVLATQETRVDDDEGRHTTTHRELLLLPGGGMVIDTPGIRELQLAAADSSSLDETFGDVEELAAACRFNDCAHDTEPGCAVHAALADGSLPRDRYDSWLKLQRELRSIAVRTDARLRKEERKRWHQLTEAARTRTRHR